MKPSELFNDIDETKELLCGQNAEQLRNNARKGEKKGNLYWIKIVSQNAVGDT